MKTIIVLTFDMPEPDSIVEIIEHLNPPSIPHFVGEVRISIDPWASVVEAFLDKSDD